MGLFLPEAARDDTWADWTIDTAANFKTGLILI
jgi:hypothetical protein